MTREINQSKTHTNLFAMIKKLYQIIIKSLATLSLIWLAVHLPHPYVQACTRFAHFKHFDQLDATVVCFLRPKRAAPMWKNIGLVLAYWLKTPQIFEGTDGRNVFLRRVLFQRWSYSKVCRVNNIKTRHLALNVRSKKYLKIIIKV